ncbi:deacetylase, including yeast histone deacetylase and acetoin utilization protein [Luminiphilus syltensis NOR5-1B]|uniref:Deacetylase, including yeast histone deacetylase and acetoin utilization protein n=1 Tax=Luminiphilus syltensis NOR5-1B TaxID=565045 RepID=B8KQR7_9GAMM|nr:histone deacetylase family protein [Luminiphilus syltensis]EED35699.1 deacetylase, including yeast histone deacetylase and acetoin utilization protein [Luminiphilus syltensis NOR5-1B]
MLIYTHSDCLEHETQSGHPERPDRLRGVWAHLERTGFLQDCEVRDAPLASAHDLGAVHAGAYLEQLRALSPEQGLVQVDPDTALCPASLAAATRAAGAVVDGTRAVLAGEADSVFCAVRPPGHHAESDAAMGFCLFNSVAVAAHFSLGQPGIERVAILDFDVHHGNGTVQIFADDPRVLVCSSFQYPFYPGRYDELIRDHVILTPLAAGSDGNVFRRAVEQDWFDRISRHAPQLIFVSAGFDAHHLDPLGGLNLTESDFTWVTGHIKSLANSYAQGRVVSALEGGYDIGALSTSALAHVEALRS